MNCAIDCRNDIKIFICYFVPTICYEGDTMWGEVFELMLYMIVYARIISNWTTTILEASYYIMASYGSSIINCLFLPHDSEYSFLIEWLLIDKNVKDIIMHTCTHILETDDILV